MSAAENRAAPLNTAGNALREIDHVDAQLDALLDLLDAAGDRPIPASSLLALLQPARTRLATAAEDLTRLLGR